MGGGGHYSSEHYFGLRDIEQGQCVTRLISFSIPKYFAEIHKCSEINYWHRWLFHKTGYLNDRIITKAKPKLLKRLSARVQLLQLINISRKRHSFYDYINIAL